MWGQLGLFYTPIALFKLAKGGEQPIDLNVNILRTLAEHKLQAGDTQAAIRCLEASLQFRNDSAIRERLSQARMTLAAPIEQSGRQRTVLTLAAVLFSVAGIGATIGILDYVITSIFSSLMHDMTSLFVVIFSWMPFLALTFIGGLTVFQLIEWALGRMRCCSLALAVSLGSVAAVLTAYSLLEGSAIGEYVAALFFGGFESALDAGRPSRRIGPRFAQPKSLRRRLYAQNQL